MPSFPYKGFKNIETARQWVDSFVEYYNNDHRHSSLNHLTPQQRHNGEYVEILKQRKEILEQAREKKLKDGVDLFKTANWKILYG